MERGPVLLDRFTVPAADRSTTLAPLMFSLVSPASSGALRAASSHGPVE
jgi:hypothetical protein